VSEWNLSVRLTGQGSDLARTLRTTARDARAASRDVNALRRDLARLRSEARSSIRVRLDVDAGRLRRDVQRALTTAGSGQRLGIRLGVDAGHLRSDVQRALAAARSGQGLAVNLRLANATRLRQDVEEAVRVASAGQRIAIPIGLADPMQLRRDVSDAVRWAGMNQTIRVRVAPDTSPLRNLPSLPGGGGGAAGFGLAGLLPIATAAIPLIAGVAANLAPLAGMLAATGGAATAFGIALAGQIGPLQEAADAEKAYQEALRDHGQGSAEAAQAQLDYQRKLNALPPETQKAAVALSGLKTSFRDWSNEVSGFTMGPVTKGMTILQQLFPHLTPEVEAFSGSMDRLMNVAGGAINTPGFDALSNHVAELTESNLDQFTDGVVHLLRVLSEGRAGDGALGRVLNYMQTNGPAAEQAVDALGDAIGNLLAAGAQAGPTMLTLVTAAARLVAALPPEVVSVILQIATALKLMSLAGAAAAAIAGPIGRLSTAVRTLGTTSAAAGGGIVGLRAALASLSTGAKIGGAVAAVGALVLALHELTDDKPAMTVDGLSTSLNTLISTGKVTGQLNTNLDDMAASIAMVSKSSSDNKLLQWTSDFGSWIGIATGPGISEAKDNVAKWDQSMANLVKAGHPKEAAKQYELLKKAWKAGGGDMQEFKEATTGYTDALADAAFEQKMTADSMGMFGQAALDTKLKLDSQRQSADGLRASIMALNDTNRSAYDTQLQFEASMDALTEAFAKNGATLDQSTEKGRANGQAMSAAAKAHDEMIAAGLAAGESLGSMVGKSDKLRESMMRLATDAFDGNKAKATEYVNTLLGVPGQIKTEVILERKAALSGLHEVEAAIYRTPGAKRVVVSTLNAAAIAALEAVGLKTKQLPDGKTAVFTANGTALGNIGAVRAALDALDGKTAHTYTTHHETTVRRTIASNNTSGRPQRGEGGYSKYADGGVVDYFANGGIQRGGLRSFAMGAENHVAQIAPAGSWRVWGEPETQGEGYVPFARSKRVRSRAITEEIVRRLGGDPAAIEWNANGSVTDWRYDPQTGSLYSGSDITSAGNKTRKVKTKVKGKWQTKEVEYFDITAVEKKLKSAAKATQAWNADLQKVADRAGGDVAEALASMGKEGMKLADKMANGSTKYLNDMSKALRELQKTAKASLTDYTRQLGTANKMNKDFADDLAKLAAMGYGDLAAQLAEQNDEAAQQLADAAVKDKGKAAKANAQAKTANSALTADQVQTLVQIIAAIKTNKTGIHDVAATTGLGEDEIIEVANKAKRQISTSLGSRADRFMADLIKANRHMAYADGGIRAGMYATRGGIIRFAEPETHGEAYLPLSPSKRRSALPVLHDVATRFGLGLTDARATRPVVIVRESSPTNVTVTAVRTGATASDIASQVGRSVRRARRGGVAARAA
jgi:hypothetical protein